MKNFCLLICVFLTIDVFAQPFVSVESGIVATAYNETKIPAGSGNYLSLSNDLDANPQLYFRGILGYALNERSSIQVLYAPLTVIYSGALPIDFLFNNYQFLQADVVDATYRFDSYRITYKYSFVKQENIELALGITGKIRDAETSFDNGKHKESYYNTGFVPLVHFYFNWNVSERFALNVQGDGFAVKQGRAEDFLINLNCALNDKLSTYIGYRLLEGGSDGSSVYTFAFFNYGAWGFTYSF